MALDNYHSQIDTNWEMRNEWIIKFAIFDNKKKNSLIQKKEEEKKRGGWFDTPRSRIAHDWLIGDRRGASNTLSRRPFHPLRGCTRRGGCSCTGPRAARKTHLLCARGSVQKERMEAAHKAGPQSNRSIEIETRRKNVARAPRSVPIVCPFSMLTMEPRDASHFLVLMIRARARKPFRAPSIVRIILLFCNLSSAF